MIFHYLARAVIFAEEKVLLAHQIGADNTFLPGGHIEFGESAESALVREIVEEIGRQASVRRFLGAVEWVWSENGQVNHEINLLFQVSVDGLDPGASPHSNEPHLEFIWSKPDELRKRNLLPPPMIECLEKGEDGYRAYWGTFKGTT